MSKPDCWLTAADVLYQTFARATGGRDGHSATLDGAVDARLSTPKELSGGGGGVNPEQLFATGYAACFLGAMKFVVSRGGSAKVPADVTVTSTVGIERACVARLSPMGDFALREPRRPVDLHQTK